MALAHEKIYTEEDYYSIPEDIRAGVREYWIVNPSDSTILVYRLEDLNFDNISYSFQDKIKAGIYEDFFIDFSELDLE